MDTVVILDNDNRWLDNCKRMLESFNKQMDLKFFKQPEEAIEYVKHHPVAVFVGEQEMPFMSGEELFRMIEMISPSTVKIIMTQVRDVKKILDIFNVSKINRIIVKPFNLAEELADPILNALEYYGQQQKKSEQHEKMVRKLENLNQRIDELSEKIEKKKQKYAGISDIAVGIIRGNLNSEAAMLSPEETSQITLICEEILKEFLKYYMFEERNFIFHINYLMNLFHYPGKECNFRIQNKTEQEIPPDIMTKLAYGILLSGYYCKHALTAYHTVLTINMEDSFYVLQISCKYAQEGEVYKIKNEKCRQLLERILTEIARTLSDKMLSRAGEQEFAAKLYYKHEGIDS